MMQVQYFHVYQCIALAAGTSSGYRGMRGHSSPKWSVGHDETSRVLDAQKNVKLIGVLDIDTLGYGMLWISALKNVNNDNNNGQQLWLDWLKV